MPTETPEWVTLTELAKRLGISRSAVKKFALSRGFSFHKVRCEGTRGQRALAFTADEADVLTMLREAEHFSLPGGAKASQRNGEIGWFYVIQLVPEIAPGRIKLGFAQSAERRLDVHRVSSPTAELVKTWRCKRTWEQTAIDSVTREGCRKIGKVIGAEVFDTEDLPAVVDRANSFFSIMPHIQGG